MKRIVKTAGVALLLIVSAIAAKAQDVALKTNLLGWATTSCNVGLEMATGQK